MADAAAAIARGPTDEILLMTAKAEVADLHERRQQSVGGGDDVQDSLDRFKFGNMGLSSLPEELVDVIKDEAVRLALDRNKLTSLSGLTSRFSEFTRLKYLVIRNNQLNEFPTCILSVPTIESLDLKGNLIEALPEDISRLNNLKNFSVRQNNIRKLPVCIGKMYTLQRLTTRHNPITFPPKDVWKVRERLSESDHEEKNNDIKETKALKRYLAEYGSRKPSRHDHTETDLTDMTVETPRPTRRLASGRFPIRPSISSIDISNGPPPVSPLPSRTAPLVSKNGPRLPPTPINAFRPGGDATTLDGERNRSHSESHMSTSKRKKRMGIQMSRGGKGSSELNLDTIGMPSDQTDHSRGWSNGSTTAFGSGTDTVANSSGSGSPIHQDPPRSALLSRLSSLPESKRKSTFQDPYIELVQGISFSMEQVHGPVKQLINLIKITGAKPRSLERHCYSALTSMNTLNQRVLQMQTFDEEKDEEQAHDKSHRASTIPIQETCKECISSFEVLIVTLLKEVRIIVERANPRIVRTLIHLLFGSSIELRNSYARFAAHFGTSPKTIKATHQTNASNFISNGNGPSSPIPRPTTSLRIKDRDRRTRNESTTSDLDKPLPRPKVPYSPYTGSISYTGSTLTSAGSFANGSKAYSHNSNLPYTPSLTPSASFISASSYTGVEGFEDFDEDQQFGIIFQKLSFACDTTIQGLSRSTVIFSDAQRRAIDLGASEADISTCKLTCARCKYALDSARDLQRRLATLKVHETQTRNMSEFWQLCTAFTRAYFMFAQDLRALTKMGYVKDDIKPLLKPVQRAVKDASAAIHASPWRELAVPPSRGSIRRRPHPHNPTGLGLQTKGLSTAVDPWEPGSAVSSNSLSSGYQTPLPATPQSAALGPAAVATLPSIPSGPVPSGPQLPASYYSSAASLERARSVSQRR
ncbi:MAG: RAM signaling network component [Chrysothrix sp. TS-e1954]|nr:MAG: RAM signaling network component [Chrysothrix sp. TS-e1954]